MKTSRTVLCTLAIISGVCYGLWANGTVVLAQNQAATSTSRSEDLTFESMSHSTLDGNLKRAAVPGGWLIVLEANFNSKGPAMAFVPDATHEWDGKSVSVSK